VAEACRARAGASGSGAEHFLVEAERTLLDFLDNHDSGDAGGDGAIASNLGAYIGAAPITRCYIEVLSTTVPNTTTTTFHGAGGWGGGFRWPRTRLDGCVEAGKVDLQHKTCTSTGCGGHESVLFAILGVPSLCDEGQVDTLRARVRR